MSNLTWKHLLALVIICFTIFMIVVAISMPNSEAVAPVENSGEQPAEVTSSQNELEAVDSIMKGEFIHDCSLQGASEQYCACTYQYIIDEVGFVGFEQLIDTYSQTGQLDDTALDAIDECLHLL